MIVVDEGERWRLITQPDHGFFAGEILGLWREAGVAGNVRRGELIFAGREHDNGWREADAAPRWDEGRARPVDFMAMPGRERRELWERGTARYASERPYAALLITRHARELHADRRGREGWTEFLEAMDEREEELREATGASDQIVATDYRFLDLADRISLAACNASSRPIDYRGLRIHFHDGTVHLDPLPLAGATTFRVPCRSIPNRPYRGDADLVSELAAARWQELTVKLAGPQL
jgi:Protein of unknown function (DUF3891)